MEQKNRTSIDSVCTAIEIVGTVILVVSLVYVVLRCTSTARWREVRIALFLLTTVFYRGTKQVITLSRRLRKETKCTE